MQWLRSRVRSADIERAMFRGRVVLGLRHVHVIIEEDFLNGNFTLELTVSGKSVVTKVRKVQRATVLFIIRLYL